ncbi:MAG: creatinine amidohydrolase [Cyclobacteriaceae bacterium]|nr:MAG: creatinine amidohydrolase [Cyclobacteriaceae bacterium]
MIFSDLSYEIINKQAEGNISAVLPLGAIEQHGPHLAVSTDTSLVTRIASQAEKLRPDKILLCPTLPFGSSHHHLQFGGTLSLSITTYTQVVVDLVESLVQNGFNRIILLNGHGGNIVPGKQALAVLNDKNDKTSTSNIVLATYWELAGDAFTKGSLMESPALSHACEYETSLLLHLFPEKVNMKKAERATRPDPNWYIPYEEESPYRGVSTHKPTQFISNNGSSGEPQLATTEKGKYLFDHAVQCLVKFVDSFCNWPFLINLKSNE